LLQSAAKNGFPSIVTALAAAGTNLEAAMPDGYTALLLAAQKGFPEVCTALAAAGANLEAALPAGTTAFILAAQDAENNDETVVLSTVEALLKAAPTLKRACRGERLRHERLHAQERCAWRWCTWTWWYMDACAGAVMNGTFAVFSHEPLKLSTVEALLAAGADVNHEDG